MIGVIADPAEHGVVREFFELFKTPWEFYNVGRRYDVVVCADDASVPDDTATLVVIYSGRGLASDAAGSYPAIAHPTGGCLLWDRLARLPIYGEHVTFSQCADSFLVLEATGDPSAYSYRSGERQTIRIGYDLFREVRTLLVAGQPAANAEIPALDHHIGILRELIVASGIRLVEIPPAPEGYSFIACLTHDVDHPSIRIHRFDRTIFGFLYRATVGSLLRAVRGRLSLHNLCRNWAAALRLPFVYMKLADDLWPGFAHYLAIDERSSFFVIPFRKYPGRTRRGPAPAHRAARYGAADVADQIRRVLLGGSEVGLHGIDAWMDGPSARQELDEIQRVSGRDRAGVRMHWLYSDQESFAALEDAGAEYDSTVGYNETIGYRSGTTQVYKPLAAERLLELPLHIMDTALFFPGYLDLSFEAAFTRTTALIADVRHWGGCLTVNWHDRSMAPERLWGEFYLDLTAELRSNGAWFATASQAVSWFRKRRSVSFEEVAGDLGGLCIRAADDASGEVPGLRLRVHRDGEAHDLPLTCVAESPCREIGRERAKQVSSS